MVGWLIKIAQKLDPIMAPLKAALLSGPQIQVDETPFQVLNEPGRSNRTKSTMWVFRGGDPQKPVICFRYFPTRSADVAREVLRNYRGYCQTDGFAGYESLEKTHPWLRMVLCLAHARRFFVRVIEARPQSAKGKTGRGEVALG